MLYIGSMSGWRMLVVDDEESIGFAVKRYFLQRGFIVHDARELEEAKASCPWG